jgi:hypothetical protein
MNGRLYDPKLRRFLSPDVENQIPDNSQNYNRYSYCMNNPLNFVDPSGNDWGDYGDDYGDDYYGDEDGYGGGNDYNPRPLNDFERFVLTIYDWLLGRPGIPCYGRDNGHGYDEGSRNSSENNDFDRYDEDINEHNSYQENENSNYNGNENYQEERGNETINGGENQYQEVNKSFSYFQNAFTNMENVGLKGGFFVEGYTSVYQSGENWYVKTSASGYSPAASLMGIDISFNGRVDLIVNGKVVQSQNFGRTNEATIGTTNYSWLGYTNMQLPATGSVQLKLSISYIMTDPVGGRAVPLPSLTKTLLIYK